MDNFNEYFLRERKVFLENISYETVKTENKGYFVSQCRWAVFCLGAQKGNPLFVQLASLFEQYLTTTEMLW